MYAIDITVDFFYFLYTSAYLGFTHENEKKYIPNGACFRDIGLQNLQIWG